MWVLAPCTCPSEFQDRHFTHPGPEAREIVDSNPSRIQGNKLDLKLPMGEHEKAQNGYSTEELAMMELASAWVTSDNATVTFDLPTTPTIETMEPNNGTARGGTVVTMTGTNLGKTWNQGDDPTCTEEC